MATQKRKWSRGWRWTGIGVVGAVVGLVPMVPALADEVEAVSISVPVEEPETDRSELRETENPTWETARRIPAMSPFVNGTGFWGPSNEPDTD